MADSKPKGILADLAKLVSKLTGKGSPARPEPVRCSCGYECSGEELIIDEQQWPLDDR